MAPQPGYCRTFSGRLWNLLEPDPRMVNLDDIAVALSRQARFNGHTRAPYFVGQHAVIVAAKVLALTDDPLAARAALHHDDDEAYLGDTIAPVKRLPELAFVRELCDRNAAAIATAFSLMWPYPPIVHTVDQRMCGTEQRDLMVGAVPDYEPYEDLRLCVSADEERFDLRTISVPLWSPARCLTEFLHMDDRLRMMAPAARRPGDPRR